MRRFRRQIVPLTLSKLTDRWPPRSRERAGGMSIEIPYPIG